MLRGSNCFLRLPTTDDARFMLAVENDSRYWHLSKNDTPFSLTDIEQFIANVNIQLSIDGQFRMMICDNVQQQPLGMIDVFEYDFISKSAGIGIFIIETARMHGIGTEALKMLIDYLITAEHLQTIWANIQHENTASISLFTKAGFSISHGLPGSGNMTKTPTGEVCFVLTNIEKTA